jgi:Cys-rich repeat protein
MDTIKLIRTFALLFFAGCSATPTPSEGDQSTNGQSIVAPGGSASTQDCCPRNFDLYSCTKPDGSMGLACHNPAQGCPSSATCGEGCDREVTGRCQCIQTVLCIRGDHFDRDLCKCVPDQDAGPVCVQNVLCVRGDHFDRDLCKCVPDAPQALFCASDADCPAGEVCQGRSPIDCPPNALCVPARTCVVPDAGTNSCTTAADCKGVLPALCQQCSDGSPKCAHFECSAGHCEVAICPK